jgi:multisubunit Na+/H+ antiporter MnhB subunit
MEAIILLQWAFDALLGVTLFYLAWLALSTADLFRAIVLFIAFGLLLALVWIRLDAPDIALAEAAIGAGLTGALLLAGLAKLQIDTREESLDHQSAAKQELTNKKYFKPLSTIAVMLLAIMLGYSVLSLPTESVGLVPQVNVELENSGVTNPVTAVLLNFRGYDTLLEMVVLLVALLAVWSFDSKHTTVIANSSIVLDIMTRLLVPLMIVVAAYLLWVGADAPGGAFQAGSVLGAAGVLLLLTGWSLKTSLAGFPLKLALVIGNIIFILTALITAFSSAYSLQFPPAQAGLIILIIETAATISIGVTLAALFLGARPINKEKQ